MKDQRNQETTDSNILSLYTFSRTIHHIKRSVVEGKGAARESCEWASWTCLVLEVPHIHSTWQL